MSSYHRAEATLTVQADDGSTLELFDVTEGRHLHLLDSMCDLHCRAFPEHVFAAAGIRSDAVAPSQRNGIVVHQWVLTANGEPVAYSLSDSNLVRRVAPIHFLSVAERDRTLTINDERIGTWFLRDSLRQYAVDAGEPGLGACAETPDYKLPIFLPNGWRVLPVTYLEPIHGSTWREHGFDTREVALIWLPAAGLDPEAVEPQAIGPSAAAFLLDMYELDASVEWVAQLCGTELDRPRPVR